MLQKKAMFIKKISTQNNFDILRLVLAVLVFFTHWNTLTLQQLTNPLFHLSSIAVDMFFIVSGFLIFWSFNADQNKKNFFIKRFFRVFPLYAILIILQTLFFMGFSDGNLMEITNYFLANISFLNFLSPSVGTTFNNLEINAINGSLWTIKNEVAFYVLMPLIFFFYKKMGIFFLLTLYGLSVLYMFFIDYLELSTLLVLFPAQLRLFTVGILLYILFDKMQNKHNYSLVAGSFLLIVLFKDVHYFKFLIYPFLLGYVMMYIVFFVKNISINFDFSYSFYVIHFPIIQLALFFKINPQNPTVSFISLFLITLILSYLSERYLEVFFIQKGRSLLKKYNLQSIHFKDKQ